MSLGVDVLEMSSDEEDEILGNLRRGGAGTASTMDPYGKGTKSSSDPKTTGASSSLDFAAMREVFQEAGLAFDDSTTPPTTAEGRRTETLASTPADNYSSSGMGDDYKDGLGPGTSSSDYSEYAPPAVEYAAKAPASLEASDEYAPPAVKAPLSLEASDSTFGGMGSSEEYYSKQKSNKPVREPLEPELEEPELEEPELEEPERKDPAAVVEDVRVSEDSLRVDLVRDDKEARTARKEQIIEPQRTTTASYISAPGGLDNDYLSAPLTTAASSTGTFSTHQEEEVNLGTMRFDNNAPLGTPASSASYSQELFPAKLEIIPVEDKKQENEQPPSTYEDPMETNASTVYSPPGVDESFDVPKEAVENNLMLTPAAAEDDPEDRWLKSKVPSTVQAAVVRPVRDESPPPPPPSRPKNNDLRDSVAPPPPSGKKASKYTDEQLVSELERDNERLAASLGAAYERLAAAEDGWERERSQLKRELALLKTEGGLRDSYQPQAKTAASLRSELAVEAERDALVEELTEERALNSAKMSEVRSELERVKKELESSRFRTRGARLEASQERIEHKIPNNDEHLEQANAALRAKIEWHVENERLVDEQLDKVESQSRELRKLRAESSRQPSMSNASLRKRNSEMETKVFQLQEAAKRYRRGGGVNVNELLKANRPTRSVDIARNEAERRCKDLEEELEENRNVHELRVRSLWQEFEKLRAAHEKRLRDLRRENGGLRTSMKQHRESNDEPPPPPPPPPRSFIEPADDLKLRSLQVELEREREMRLRAESSREPMERGLEREIATLSSRLKESDRLGDRLGERQLELVEKLKEAHSELSQRPPLEEQERREREHSRLRERLQETLSDLEAMRAIAKLAAQDASSTRRQLAFTSPTTPTQVAVSALTAHVDALERNGNMRQAALESALQEAKSDARIELARSDSRRREELAVKDAQIERFRTELDALLRALQIELARRSNEPRRPKKKQATEVIKCEIVPASLVEQRPSSPSPARRRTTRKPPTETTAYNATAARAQSRRRGQF